MSEALSNAAQPAADESGIDLDLNITGMNGDTELSFSKDQVRVTWADSTASERGLIRGLVQTSKMFGFEPYSVDEDGKPKEKLTKLPGTFRGKKGQLILKGTVKRVKMFAQEMIEGEVKNGRIAFQAQKDGTWKAIRPGEFKPEPGKKQKVTTSAPVGGG